MVVNTYPKRTGLPAYESNSWPDRIFNIIAEAKAKGELELGSKSSTIFRFERRMDDKRPELIESMGILLKI